MDKCIQKEWELAEELGWKDIQLGGKTAKDLNVPPTWLIGICPDTGFECFIPQWTRSWSQCGPLMVEHEISILYMVERVEIESWSIMRGYYSAASARYSDHPNKDLAVMFGVVQAVIMKLREGK